MCGMEYISRKIFTVPLARGRSSAAKLYLYFDKRQSEKSVRGAEKKSVIKRRDAYTRSFNEQRAKTMREAVRGSRIVSRKRQFISRRVVRGSPRAEMSFYSSRRLCWRLRSFFKRSLLNVY